MNKQVKTILYVLLAICIFIVLIAGKLIVYGEDMSSYLSTEQSSVSIINNENVNVEGVSLVDK